MLIIFNRITGQNSSFSKQHDSNCDRMMLKLHHPQKSIVASMGNGRLGNQMSNFASTYAIMKEYGMYPYLNSNQLNALKKVFLLPEPSNSDEALYFLWEKGTA